MSGQIRNMVVGVASAEAPEPALAPAVELAEELGATLHVVHAALLSDPLLDAYATLGYLTPDAVLEHQERTEAALREQVQRLTRSDRVRWRVVTGPPAQVLTDEAERVKAELIVVGGTRRGTLARTILGTTAQQVLRGAHAPVLLLQAPLRGGPRRVLLTTDFSALSGAVHDRGLEVVRALAGANRPALRSLFVAAGVVAPVTVRREVVQEVVAREFARYLAERDSSLGPVEARVREGDPAKEIVAEAAEWGADLVVLGTHGRSRTLRFLLGSVAEATLRSALGNVLVIPAAAVAAAPATEPAPPPALDILRPSR